MNPALRQALIVLLGYGLAVVAAPILVLAAQTAIALTFGGPSELDDIVSFLLVGMMLTSTYSAAPFLGAIALMRWQRRYDWPTHAMAGMVVSYIAMWLFTGNLARPDGQQIPFLLGGFGAGLVYWLCRRRFGWPQA